MTLDSTGSLSSGSTNFDLTVAGEPNSGAASVFIADEINAATQLIAGDCNLWLGAVGATNWIVAGFFLVGPLPLDSSGLLTVPVMLASMTSLSGPVIDL